MPRISRSLLWLGLIFILPACTSSDDNLTSPPLTPWFEEVSASSRIDFHHIRATSSNFYFPEIMAGGIGWIDYDNDGLYDLYIVQAGDIDSTSDQPTNKLFRNVDGIRFEDVTASAMVGDTGYGMGIAVGDIDNDGDADIYITNVGANVLYQNNGDGSFSNIASSAGVDHAGWGASASFADINQDGLLDLYVVNYINWAPERELECFSGGAGRDYCHPDNYRAPAADVLYLNKGNGQFEDISASSGISEVSANGLGVFPADFDGDGQIDIYVANDGNPNQLWINKGNNVFEDRALLTGTAVNRQGTAEAGMGVAVFDLENDGDADIFLSHLRDETNTLYRNDGVGFQDLTIAAGLSSSSLPFTGFGISTSDFDYDGYLDLYIANGKVGRAADPISEDPFAEPDLLFQGLPAGKFTESPLQGGVEQSIIATGRGLASADYDNDGDIDIAVINNNGPVYLLKNIAEKKGNWIGFSLVKELADGNVTPVYNALVTLQTNQGIYRRLSQSAGSYQSANEARIQFGIPSNQQIQSVDVQWPNGTSQRIDSTSSGMYHQVILAN